MRWPYERLHIGPRLLVVAGLILLLGPPAASAPQAEGPKPAAAQPARTDFYGDPLPPGAIARLGTLRDCIVGPSGDIVLSLDGTLITATTQGWWRLPFRLWEVETGRVLLELKELDRGNTFTHPHCAAFSPDSKLIAVGDGAGTVRIGRTDTGRKVLEIPGPEIVGAWDRDLLLPDGKASVADIAFLPDGKSLAVAYTNGVVWLYRLPTGERTRFLLARDGKFSPDGKTMAVRRGIFGTSVRDLLTGKEMGHRPRYRVPSRSLVRSVKGMCVPYTSGFPLAVAFSPNGKLVAFAGRGQVLLWDVATGRESRWFPRRGTSLRRLPGIEIDDSWEFHVAFSPDGKLLAAEDDRKGLCLWNTTTGLLYRRFPSLEIGHGIAFTPDGKRLISGGRSFRYWDIARGQEIQRFPKFDELRALAFGPDGKTVATADGEVVRLWEASNGREIRQYHGHRAEVYALAIAPDGKTIASEDDDATLIVWDLSSGREVRRFAGLSPPLQVRLAEQEDHWVASVAFSPDGKSLVAADEGGARIWDTATGREIRRIRGGRGAIRSLCFAPDGQTFAGIDDRGVAVWDVATGREKSTSPHRQGIALAFAPVGHALAAVDVAGTVELRDSETRKWLRLFRTERHAGPDQDRICSLAFTPDGKALAAASDDGFVRLWDTTTGRLRHQLKGHIGFVSAIAIAPDGKALASASEDGTALIWDLTALGND